MRLIAKRVSLRAVRCGLAGIGVLVLALGVAAPAFASSGVWWGLTSGSWPGQLPASGKGVVVVTAQNRGYETVDATEHPVVVRDTLPAGLEASALEGTAAFPGGSDTIPLTCRLVSAREAECRMEGVWSKTETHPAGEHRLLTPYHELEVRIDVNVLEGASSGERNVVSVSGGGAAGQASISRPIEVASSGQKTPFGVEFHELIAEEEGGTPTTQAGKHPFQLTDVLGLNTSEVASDRSFEQPAGMAKDLTFNLPPGVIGNPTVLPQCTEAQFSKVQGAGSEAYSECPSDSAIGVAAITYYEPKLTQFTTEVLPLFNLVPLPGEPARFGFEPVAGIHVYMNTAVRTGSDYGVTVSVRNIVQITGFLGARVTIWGVPGAAVHDTARGNACLATLSEQCPSTTQTMPPPFLSMPTSCSGPMMASVQADSWAEPKPADPLAPPLFVESSMPGLDGCNHLQFNPEISVSPDVPNTASASGLEVKVHVPQSAQLTGEGLAEGTVRDTTVVLPAGVTLNPGGAEGLSSCTLGQIGFLGKSASEDALNLFTPTLGQAFCAQAAKIGTVAIQTPLLPNPLTGAVYLASPAPSGEPGQNPFNTLVAMYIVAEDPVSGTLVKLPGYVLRCETAGQMLEGEKCEAPGQLVSTFKDTPQLPFENLILHFFGGAHAPLATPTLCGSYTSRAAFVPWSAEPGEAPHQASSTFQITSGPHGAACPPDPLPFTPEFTAGTVNNQAGAFSELRTTMGHPDIDQPLGGLTVTMPPGLMGSLAQVKLCGEPQAAQGTCGPESLIGHTTVTAGLGASPAVVKRPGNVYITGPYTGHGACTVGQAGCAPFGLSIANPAEAGPFDLMKGSKCDCIVVRAKVEVNPHTAQLTIATGRLPTMLKGIPLDLQHIEVGIDRPSFTFNPTNCQPMRIQGTLTGAEGATIPISEPFQAANCAHLPFTPTFKAITNAHHTRKDGASLHVKLTATQGQANVREVHVELPTQLPSELKTLQHACTEAQFNTNPSGCPAESIVGHATVRTPVLPVPLEGPAYFVSHGGAKWPELTMVLQGYGVTVILNGETFIDQKTGVTSTTFKTVPDVPFSTFELTLPAGEHSALAANGNLCREQLHMPIRMTAQSGRVLEENTKVGVQGCKPTLYIIKKKTRGNTAHLVVQVPSAGKLTMTGNGIRRETKKTGKAQRVTQTIRLTNREEHKLVRAEHDHGGRKHHAQRLTMHLHLNFKPKHGKTLTKTLKLKLT